MSHNSPTTPTKSSFTGGGPLILICAPLHDDLTEYTSGLLENLGDLGEPTVFRKIESPLAYDELLSELPAAALGAEVMVVFCGHGETSALLGPGGQSGAPDYGETSSPFYDESHLYLGPTRMLAFCCKAGAGLGVSYEHKTQARSFVGFKDDVLIVMEGGDYAACWSWILDALSRAVLREPDRRRLARAVRDIYRDAIASFPPEKDSVYNWGLMMRACLLQQLEDIKVVRT